MGITKGTTKYIKLILHLLFLLITQQLPAQTREPVSYVDPFIGTTKSSVLTRWGGEGGTYPGAVAPSGYLQLTPETRVNGARGYDFSDSVIYYFSCLHHFSGFPSGSTGDLLVMPVDSRADFQPAVYKRRFSHQDEKAIPGYYSVLFRDNQTLVEATAGARGGMFRFTFPEQVRPVLFISDSGNFYAALRFSEPPVSKQPVKGGYLLRFAPASSGAKVILLRISASTVSKESAEKNITVELKGGFDQLKEHTRREWNQALSVIEIADNNDTNKTIFYTALYHSLLMPWVISDTDGQYRGADGRVHALSGRQAYGGFSPWDTFRSLHPLLCLLYPDKQREMVLSMLDVFRQTGHLPVESMTGNHAVPIVADSYLKGIGGIDSLLAYTAMKKSIADTPHLQPDMAVFRQQGYIPFSYPESVTRTVEYAYDDWVLAQFAAKVMRQQADHQRFLRSSYAYRALFYPPALSFLPRQDSLFKLQPGTSGYKEGDQWIYSYFAPQHQQDLINLMGGRQLFTERLDAALREQQIVFDNETVVHVPWLFNAAGAPSLTQKWVGEILQQRFAASPGGLPGNDDLGAMSSWYVLSAMGIYPICPGSPEYSIGTPLFRSLHIRLQNGRSLHIQRNGAYPYIKAVELNNRPYQDITISHESIREGGSLVFETSASPARWPDTIREEAAPRFRLQSYSASKNRVGPHELFYIRFSLRNEGHLGTKLLRLYEGTTSLGYKNCLADSGAAMVDSIPCRLYREGAHQLRLDNGQELTVIVVRPDHPYPEQPAVSNFELSALIKKGDMQECSFTIQNTGGAPRSFELPLFLDERLLSKETVSLQPGEEKRISRSFRTEKEGWHVLQLFKEKRKFKAYSNAAGTLLLDLRPNKHADGKVIDASGFGNDGHIIRSGEAAAGQRLLLGRDCFIEVPGARSLDVMGTTITMMAWVYPTAAGRGLVDLFTKGDVHVLQVSGNRTLTFFAGGWGRGECSAPLPANWKDNWHHIAGVCDGNSLKLYIDGALKGYMPLEDTMNLSVSNKWNLGRNEEFPAARIFNGYMDQVKVFAAPLSATEIRQLMGAQP
jgi:putative alpha-1,2-mannosidase